MEIHVKDSKVFVLDTTPFDLRILKLDINISNFKYESQIRETNVIMISIFSNSEVYSHSSSTVLFLNDDYQNLHLI